MGLRAMFNSISGLQSDSQWLDVIGNNISNVNTVGYKSSRVEFSDQFSQTLTGALGSDPSGSRGGTNPLQVGLGTRVASIQTLFTPGSTQMTGISTDISIQGNGFLVAKNQTGTYLTRAGNLTFDSAGFLVDQNGSRIQGFNGELQYTKNILTSAIAPFGPFPPVFPLGYNGNPTLFITQGSIVVNNQALNSLGDIQISRDMVLLPKATTEVKFKGNLDSFQQATQPGGILDMNPNGLPILPVAADINFFGAPTAIDTNRLTIAPLPNGGYAFHQLEDLSSNVPGVFPPPTPLINGFLNLAYFKGFAGDYAWDQSPPIPPANQVSETVYDSLGNPRQITVQFYQINDLGAGGINNPSGPNQVCYAWYAFDTTGGKTVSTANLLGGTGIYEGDIIPYDRGNPQFGAYGGDFLWFHTDGSLASSGGISGIPNTPPGLNFNFMTVPRVYLPPSNVPPPQGDLSPIPTQGAEIDSVSLDFGTFGIMGKGLRDGIYSDAEGSYQPVNGVNTYVPKSTVFAASQDGYADGVLKGLSFDETGMIQGNFSNGQTIPLAQVALSQPANSGGLSKVGNNDFAPSPNSGAQQIGLAGSGGFGTVLGGSLELSNVDLTLTVLQELKEMGVKLDRKSVV